MNHRMIGVLCWCLVTACGGCGEDTPGGGGGADTGIDLGDECAEGTLACDGACVSVVDDPQHCGSCDPCPTAAGATAFCVASTCELACATGFGDADGDLTDDEQSNGCECEKSGPEVCDGADNDCDGDTDAEDPDLDLSTCPTLTGASPTGCSGNSGCVYTCADGFVDGNGDLVDGEQSNGCECSAEATADVCDGVDNDCDGATDEPGDDLLSACPDAPQATLEGCEAGRCAYLCDPRFADRNADLGTEGGDGCECTISEEICDGVDNDCDGAVDGDDEDFRLQSVCAQVAGAVAACNDRCTWTCMDGRVDVNGDLGQGANGDGCECTASDEELCDGLDNDCDGLVDADDDDLALAACPNQDGVCQGAAEVCVDGELYACDGARYADHAAERGWEFEGLGGIELGCDDNSDNNCNGQTDENCCGEGEGIVELAQPDDGDVRQIAPAIAVNGAGDRILVAWQETTDLEEDEPSFEGTVRWAVFRLDGILVGSDTVPLSEGFSAVQPSATWDGSTFVVAVVIHGDQRRFLRTTRVSEQAGEAIGGNVVVDDAAGTISNPTVSGRGDGSYVVAWSFARRGQGLTPVCEWEAAQSCIQLATVTRNDVVAPFLEVSPASGAPIARWPAGAFSERDGMLAWHDADGTPDHVVVGRVVDGELSIRQRISTTMGDEPRAFFAVSHPSVIRVAAGFLVAYEDFLGTTIQIAVQRLDGQGVPQGDPLTVTDGGADKRFPQLTQMEGGVGLVWSEGGSVRFRSLSTLGVPHSDPRDWFSGRQLGFQPVRGTALARAGVWIDASADGFSPERLHLRITNLEGDLRCGH